MEKVPYVLVIDDEKGIRDMIAFCLDGKGFRVFSAENGDDGIRIAEENNMDVIILDIRMKGENGINVLNRIKKDFPEIEVIMTTGFAATDTAIESLRLKAYDYIKKPYDINELAKRINMACRKKRDAEQLHKMISLLMAKNAELERFAFIASHNLKEPMIIISNYVDLIRMRYADKFDAEGQKFLVFAKTGTEKMRSMIDGLDKYAKIIGKSAVITSVDVNDVLNETAVNLKINEKDATLEYDAMPKINADEDEIYELFQNLINNAVKFKADRPVIVRVGAEDKTDRWVFSVADNGIGIEKEQLSKVFRLFEKLHNDEAYTGAGIGLILCKSIVEKLGGTIWIESEPGKGTTVYFTVMK
jgi:light-regulated signal transduction histidine kinase (bacteriophytochrome)